MRTLAAALGLAVLVSCVTKETELSDSATRQAPEFDPQAHLFLEEVEGEEALAWVRAQNDRSLAVLQGDERYERYYEAALEIATSSDRIPYGSIRNGYVYNFWQDDEHVRGIWRRTTLESYSTSEPEWETLLDVDALAEAEGKNWVYAGVSCLQPENTKCLISLSDGGKDAAVVREWDLETRSFVEDGFIIPEAKTDDLWVDDDTLLVATDWGEGTLTESGYPFVIKRVKHGQPLDQAQEIFRGEVEDVAASPFALEDVQGREWFGVLRAETFYTTSYFLLRDDDTTLRLPVPMKSSPHGIYEDTLLVELEEDWTPEGQAAFEAGDLVGFSWSGFLADETLPPVELVLRPTARQALQDVEITPGGVLVTLSDNVVLKVQSWTRGDGGWSATDIDLPANGSAGVTFADEHEQHAFLSFESFLEPDTLYAYDTDTGALSPSKSLPQWFDAGPYVAEQFMATSKDGTQVPYFVVRARETELNGENPTMLYGYGGFQVSYTPSYSGTIGRLWLAEGGVYVLANIRGGGEFGPAWHQAGLKTNRQVIYDDFIAVAEDLISRGVTSNEKLGIVGGSNGGLLMGVMFTQRPDLFAAVVCQVPLLDMLRYHMLLAGASWMGEYGDPDIPEERAFLESISPYHNIDSEADYPEIYFETSTKDDRVHPGHARKMAKRLEELGKPFLYYENIDGGHSAAANQKEAARRAALEYTYLARKLIDGE